MGPTLHVISSAAHMMQVPVPQRKASATQDIDAHDSRVSDLPVLQKKRSLVPFVFLFLPSCGYLWQLFVFTPVGSGLWQVETRTIVREKAMV